jgi:hypothetical protein
MSLLRAAGAAVSTTLNGVTIAANSVNDLLIAGSQGSKLLRSNAERWAQSGILANEDALLDLTSDVERIAVTRMVEKAEAHAQWLNANSDRAAAYDQALTIYRNRRTTLSNAA